MFSRVLGPNLVASGMIDGLVEKNGKRMLIKGIVKKEKVKTVETNENVETVTERDVLKIEIVGLDLNSGEYSQSSRRRETTCDTFKREPRFAHRNTVRFGIEFFLNSTIGDSASLY